MSTHQNTLTKHPEGSMRELFSIALPLVLTLLSSNLMIFFDKLILAKYSLEALNSCAAISMTCMVFIFGMVGITSIAEVFVGQYNGAGKFDKVAGPSWQMIWFSVGSVLIFWTLAQFAGPYLLPVYHYETLGLPYFQWTLYFAPLFPMQAALASFFIGIGKTRLITFSAILSNLINIGLSILFVFGIDGFLEPMATKGAAIATGIAQSIQIAILFFAFLMKPFREKFFTHKWYFQPRLLIECLKKGVPTAIGHSIEISAWALLNYIMIGLSETHIAVMAFGQSFSSMVSFGGAALQKAVTATSANFLGAKKKHLVMRTWQSGIKLLLLLSSLFSIVLIFYPEPLIQEFFSETLSEEKRALLLPTMKLVSAFVWAYFIIDGMTWITAGVLIAGGDTVFLMMVNALSAWICALLPVYVLLVFFEYPPITIWGLFLLYAIINFLSFFLRLRSGSWNKELLVNVNG